ncbi:hypothetical protein D3C72_1320950 [compost metagenome]
MERPGQRQGDECGEGRADQHRRHQVDILPLGVRMLDHGPLRRAGQRHAQRHQRADERPTATAQQLHAVHPADAQPGDHDGRPGACGQPVPDEEACGQCGEQRPERHRDQHARGGGERQRHHEGREHHGPADARDPQRAPAAAQQREHRPPPPKRQDHQQRQHREEAAPEGDLETVRLRQVPRDNARRAPHEGHDDHQPDSGAVRQAHGRSKAISRSTCRGRRACGRFPSGNACAGARSWA